MCATEGAKVPTSVFQSFPTLVSLRIDKAFKNTDHAKFIALFDLLKDSTYYTDIYIYIFVCVCVCVCIYIYICITSCNFKNSVF